mmetsp:Transcript_67126/g.187827  ORF Transcript_67126/g.187827 Transcript_67126/m.187827 type:complete len:375 (-) Transcript_67126:32-1156(-)
MRRIQGLVAEHPVDREVLPRGEDAGPLVLLGHLVEGSRGDGCRVRAENVLPRLVLAPVVPPAGGAPATLLVHLLHRLEVVRRQVLGLGRGLDEEGVVGVASGVLLGLEERVKIPEGALDPLVRGHLLEAHQQQDVPNLRPDPHQRVQAAAPWPETADGVEVQRLELRVLPRPLQDHLGRDLRDGLRGGAELVRLLDRERCGARRRDKLPLLQRVELLPRQRGKAVEVGLDVVGDAVGDGCEGLGRLVHSDPPVLHGHAGANLADLAKGLVEVLLGGGALGLDDLEDLDLGAALRGVRLALRGQLPALALRRHRGRPAVDLQGLDHADKLVVVPPLLAGERDGVGDEARAQNLDDLVLRGRCHRYGAGRAGGRRA